MDGVTRNPGFFIDGSNIKARVGTLPITPNVDDGNALGTTALEWSDIFLASGAVINFSNGDVTMTHSANTLAFAGASSGYTFDAKIVLANAAEFTGKDTGGTSVGLLVLNAVNDAHFLANVGNGNIGANCYGGFNSDVPFIFGGSCCGGGLPTSMTFNTSGNYTYKVSDTAKMYLTTAGNVKIGGSANRGTTEGTNQLVLFNATVPAGTLTNGVSIYSDTGELKSMDAAGNATLLSPHDLKTNEWIFHSKDTRTGKVLRVDMERLMKKIDEMLGGGYVHEFMEAI